MGRATLVLFLTATGLLAAHLGIESANLKVAGPPLTKVESWTDPRLQVTGGLALWLDASRQSAARKAHGRPAFLPGEPVDVLYDGSGQGRHLSQGFAKARPHLLVSADLAALRFDGATQCLCSTVPKQSLDECTVFVLAAPRSNLGVFRALFACNETGKNDYITGLTIDLTGNGSERFDRLNVEGKGFGGAVNLLKGSHPFSEFHVVAVRVKAGKGGVQLQVDGKPAGQRDRDPGPLRLDQITLGARFYSNTPDAPTWTGFFDGDIAEVLLYQRAVSDDELRKVNAYLGDKAAQFNKNNFGGKVSGAVPLVPIANPPPVQMFVPGFIVRELPVDLTNINNVRYRADGKLVALAYDGRVLLLSDTDGDGLEDRVEVFYDNTKGLVRSPIGMALTPPGYAHGNGVFVACKGKLLLLTDSKGTGEVDKEIVVAEGWKELPHGVDALGAAVDKAGNIYFGLGTADYTNAYLVGKDNQGHYDLNNERGTILKVSADFKKREILCTGIRFPVGLAFNRAGDLFATDQEGATWLPNGNPLDELLHIQAGKHYGFPPRHPKHLPGVIDEPSTFDYGPQHQSTCGLAFNDPVNGGPIFGPSWWDGDAFVTGYSRGKLYRTKLVRGEAGYVARNQLLGALNMLAVDACVSPRGDLVVAVHSGPPDWGSGPKGKGKLYKITWTGSKLAQPVLAWPAGPREVRIAFDKPLPPEQLGDLVNKVRIEYGKYVQPGDAFESLRPGYAVVKMQLATPRFSLPILGAQVAADRRTLILATGPHPEAVSYAVTLPGFGRLPVQGAKELPQLPRIDLGYDLSGVTASWQRDGSSEAWSGWLPHLELDVARSLTQASAQHEELWQAMKKPGQLTLACKVDLWHMLRPAVQPGSTLDYTLPPEVVTLVLESAQPFSVKSSAGLSESKKGANSKSSVHVTVNPREGEPLTLTVSLRTGEGTPQLSIAYFTKEDARLRPLALHRFLVPWAPTGPSSSVAQVPPAPAELKGGDWARGRQVFFSQEAACGRCHQVGGEGGKIGPDLSNLIHRDYASVLRDIVEPSAAINPDFISYVIELKNGKVLAGVVRSEGGKLIVGEQTGKEYTIAPGDVESMKPLPTSTMPDGLDKALGPEKLRDLLTFLLTEPLRPAPLERDGAPAARTKAEVDAALQGSAPLPAKLTPLRILLAAGPKDHGPGEHDYPLWQRRWRMLLSLAEGVNVDESFGWPTSEQLRWADVVVMYSHNPGWAADKAKDLDAFLERGGGLVFIHYAIDGHAAGAELANRIGLTWKGGASQFRHGPLEVDFTASKHPIARGLGKVSFIDESYWNLQGDMKSIEVLGTGVEDGKSWPLFWTRTHGKGKVFVSVPGHYTWTFDDPLFRLLLLRGIAWTAGESVDRFNPLVTVGARLGDLPTSKQ
jgi:putative heme-binding domain-containing protein